MTILANVKGYINGAERGVYGPSLLTYEEIVAMANAEGDPYTNTLAELNAHTEEYDKYGRIYLGSESNSPYFIFEHNRQKWILVHYGGGDN